MTVDFADELPNETISLPTVTAEDVTDPANPTDSTATVISGAASIPSAKLVQFTVIAGSDGDLHQVTVGVTGSGGSVILAEGKLLVRDTMP